jgi:hypothetical protein
LLTTVLPAGAGTPGSSLRGEYVVVVLTVKLRDLQTPTLK